TWMDEGVNSFVQYLTQVENYPDMPKRRGHPEGIIPYMKGDKSTMRPLMTSGEQVVQIGDEQYNKAATALNILRETVMSPELFDHAFKEYAQRWAFKHPKPADFFRTMEDASAVDLDWFWRGWFYTTDNVDLSVDQVRWFRLREDDRQLENKPKNTKTGDLATGSNPGGGTGFANGPEPFSLIETDGRLYGEFLSRIDDKAVIDKMKGKNFYEVTLSNRGGLVMPVIIQWTYTDGTQEIERLPAEIWRTNEQKVTKVFVKDKEVSNVVIDPLKETADIDTRNNMFPKVGQPSKFDQFRKN
ncbi:MAG TPA: M1 family aminopeptidase, partial [Cyclobacteriaceae bacterium]|nr:M1 family aminopeptidase [Cyclobacteriaceae bacterium]